MKNLLGIAVLGFGLYYFTREQNETVVDVETPIEDDFEPTPIDPVNDPNFLKQIRINDIEFGVAETPKRANVDLIWGLEQYSVAWKTKKGDITDSRARLTSEQGEVNFQVLRESKTNQEFLGETVNQEWITYTIIQEGTKLSFSIIWNHTPNSPMIDRGILLKLRAGQLDWIKINQSLIDTGRITAIEHNDPSQPNDIVVLDTF